MCQYTFHNNPDCGHIANFTLDICVEMMNAMREGTKNPPGHKVTNVHDLLPKSPSYQCRPCEGKLSKGETNSSNSSDSDYVVLEGLNAGVPIVHSYMEMCLNEKNTSPDDCFDSFVHVNQPPRQETPTPAPKPNSASQTLKIRDLASSEPEIHPMINMMEELKGCENYLMNSTEHIRAHRSPSTPIRSPEQENYGDVPGLNQTWYESDSETEPEQVKSPRPLGPPFVSPHRAQRPREAPLRVSDLNSPPPSQQPGYLKATPRLTTTGNQGEPAPAYRSSGVTTPPNPRHLNSTLLPCTPCHLIVPPNYSSPPPAPRKPLRTNYTQYSPFDAFSVRREYNLPRHDVLNTILQSPPSQYPERYNRSYSRQYWGPTQGLNRDHHGGW
ncbi:hypothetical protein ASPBRDRAFT_24872 [Aspergillus brasiliensis CBS 101740]|uniref:Uncharacterized protein n=1 Tax=Aspergillus brasiliensis (strain CBS 101740 / IMI 381727 / IBT 21946) TaxID=767769 RepID=A0A1L9UZS9_ASPBC|nr:hypothetical protein ASPBRDRAFT_24872 [Aspergillus brasiliensis CBS 101740]